MKIIKKILVALFILIFITAIGAYLYVNHIQTKAIPNYSENVKLKGLKNKVTIYRDNYGIPHIYAQNDEDLYRATGYVLAQDRLWQMDLIRRATQGKLSEIFGKDMIKADYLLRSLRMTQKSKKLIKKTDKKIIKAVEAFADGINQYIENNIDNLPVEFTILGYQPEPWELIHSFNMIGYMTWDLSSAWGREIILSKVQQKIDSTLFKQILPVNKKIKSFAYPSFKIDTTELNIREELLSQTKMLKEMGLEAFASSNNWAVNGKKSKTGKPILANDMHLSFGSPGIWYQIHQNVKNGIDVTGVLLPGQPFILDGHNKNIAWGMTNIMLDDIDFYYETINPENENQYKLDGQWKDMQIVKEKIKVKGEPDTEKTIKYTHRGPIISQFKNIKNKSVSMRWTGNEFSNEIRSIYLLNRASNWNEFKDAIKTFTCGNQNINYADVNGNIGIHFAGGIPKRKGNPSAIYNGEFSENDWTGFVPFEQLPYEYNPDRNYVSSANNKSVSEKYPYYISDWFYAPAYRKQRIDEMLEEKEKLSIDDFKVMLADNKSKLVEQIYPEIIEPISKIKNLDDNQKKALEVFKKWKGTYTADSKAASIFEYFYICFAENIAKDELGNDLYNEFIRSRALVNKLIHNLILNKNSNWYDNVDTKDTKETFEDIVQLSFIASLDSLEKKLGKKVKNWDWGNIHTITIKHPLGKVDILDKIFDLNRGPFPVSGSYHTVAPYSYRFTDIFNVTAGASERHIFSTADWNKSLSVIPTGISGIPASEHYLDQTELFLNNKYHNDYFEINKIIKSSKYKMELLPKK